MLSDLRRTHEGQTAKKNAQKKKKRSHTGANQSYGAECAHFSLQLINTMVKIILVRIFRILFVEYNFMAMNKTCGVPYDDYMRTD